ncbi:MAG: hypothetical protein ABEH35_01910 [Haloarculaceae archaeon]
MRSDAATPAWVSQDREHEAGPIQLEMAIVRYTDRPDRCTVHNPDCDEIERLSTWLSADLSLAVDLESMR